MPQQLERRVQDNNVFWMITTRSLLPSRWASWGDMRPPSRELAAVLHAHVRFNECKDSSRWFTQTCAVLPMSDSINVRLPRTRVISKESWMNRPTHVVRRQHETKMPKIFKSSRPWRCNIKTKGQDLNSNENRYLHESWQVPEILVEVPSYGYNIWHKNQFNKLVGFKVVAPKKKASNMISTRKKIKTKPSSTQSRYLLAKGEKRKFKEQGVPTLSMPMTEGLVALYTEELLLDQFEFLNDHWQFVLQENKPKRQSTSPRSIFWLHRKHLALNRYQHICRYWEWEPKIDEELTSVS